MKKFCYGISVTGILLFLLLYPKEAVTASRMGLNLWFNTLLPTLLPFMILSDFLIRADLVRPLVAFISPLSYRLLHLSSGGTYALLVGFLCGYPMGAKVVSDLASRNQMTQAEAQYILGFCNNISPSFIITFLVTEQLQNPRLLVPTLIILYGSPLLWGILQNPGFRKQVRQLSNKCSPKAYGQKEALSFALIDACILSGVKTIVKLGGYIMLFAIISGIIGTLPLSAGITSLLTAFTEITNGIPALVNTLEGSTRYIALMAFTSFGGLSAIAQTESVIKSAHLSLGKYVRSKFIISIIAVFFAFCFLI